MDHTIQQVDALIDGRKPVVREIYEKLIHETPIDSPRVRKCEHASKNLFYNDILLNSADDVDVEFMTWTDQRGS